MAQVRFGHCVPNFAPRPDTSIAPIGALTQDPRARGHGDGEPRREDRRKQQYGNGVPRANSARVDTWGVGLGGSRQYEEFATSEGSVKLPVEAEPWQYTPSIETLEFLTHTQGTRLQPPHARYF